MFLAWKSGFSFIIIPRLLLKIRIECKLIRYKEFCYLVAFFLQVFIFQASILKTFKIFFLLEQKYLRFIEISSLQSQAVLILFNILEIYIIWTQKTDIH